MDTYTDFIRGKRQVRSIRGITYSPDDRLFGFQRDLVRWAAMRGRAAIFADTGLGKSRMEADWARAISQQGRVLILAPLAVAEQLVEEGAAIDVEMRYLRHDDHQTQIAVTNYDMMSHFEFGDFAGIVLDESSILKSYSGKFRNAIISASQQIPYRLAATATPSPNDYAELGNHCEFLGIQTRAEMLSEFFTHDGGNTSVWRLKKHAVTPFWEWVCAWAAVVRMPSDLGYDDAAYLLPPLRWHEHVCDVDHTAWHEMGMLFAPSVMGIAEHRALKRATIHDRAAIAAEIANNHRGSVLIWGELNRETNLATSLIEDAVEVSGADKPEDKARKLLAFAHGEIRVLVTKPKIAGFGMNFQVCHRMIFLGASHSYEQTYQAVRRCWRFGQQYPVDVHVIRADNEGAVVKNYKRKEAAAANMWEVTRPFIAESVRAIGVARKAWNEYNPSKKMEIPSWLM